MRWPFVAAFVVLTACAEAPNEVLLDSSGVGEARGLSLSRCADERARETLTHSGEHQDPLTKQQQVPVRARRQAASTPWSTEVDDDEEDSCLHDRPGRGLDRDRRTGCGW